jgi:proteic killer suppression protein
MLNRAQAVGDLDLPGYRLHALKGDRKGYWSMTISGNWRIVFRFENGEALEIDLVDYH